MSLYGRLRPALFRMEPERAHRLSLRLMAAVGGSGLLRAVVERIFPCPPRPVEVFGLRFPNRVGLAAGYDKDGLGWRGLAALGFGHVEIGTVTPRPQAGNERPRLFRLGEDGGLINRLGFPSEGMDVVAGRLGGPRPGGVILGLNLGKNKETPLEEAGRDYDVLLRRFYAAADYLVVNVSSPNTPGLRELQSRRWLEGLLGGLAASRAELVRAGEPRRPLLVKLAPDLSDEALDDALGATLDAGFDGVIATNTTVDRAGLRSPLASELGGLSGRPLAKKAARMVAEISRRTGGRLPIVAVGGIDSVDEAQARLDAGATLVQIYTGLIYRGPGVVSEIVKGLRA